MRVRFAIIVARYRFRCDVNESNSPLTTEYLTRKTLIMNPNGYILRPAPFPTLGTKGRLVRAVNHAGLAPQPGTGTQRVVFHSIFEFLNTVRPDAKVPDVGGEVRLRDVRCRYDCIGEATGC